MGGVPHPKSGWGVPIPGLDGGCSGATPLSGLDGVSPTMTGWGTPQWGTPHTMTGWGTPGHDWLGYPLARTGWGTPHHPIRQSSIASTCYAAGGMSLAFKQDDFLVKNFVMCPLVTKIKFGSSNFRLLLKCTVLATRCKLMNTMYPEPVGLKFVQCGHSLEPLIVAPHRSSAFKNLTRPFYLISADILYFLSYVTRVLEFVSIANLVLHLFIFEGKSAELRRLTSLIL